MLPRLSDFHLSRFIDILIEISITRDDRSAKVIEFSNFDYSRIVSYRGNARG